MPEESPTTLPEDDAQAKDSPKQETAGLISQTPVDVASRAVLPARYMLPGVLFLLTLLTTMLAGAYQEGGEPFDRPADILLGLPFSLALMTILFVHEMGHYLTAKRYQVQTTLPYFIPGPWFPFGIGTFGAFIRMRSRVVQRRALLDIGAAGPLAGFIAALVAVGIGLHTAEVVPAQEGGALILGDPLALSWLAHVMGKETAAGEQLIINAVGFAGWLGLFLTSVNLLPIGQLDGGHVAYAMLGKKTRILSRMMVGILIILGWMGWKGWYVWAFLSIVFGRYHPPIEDESVSFSWQDHVVGWGTFALLAVTFMPVPFRIHLP